MLDHDSGAPLLVLVGFSDARSAWPGFAVALGSCLPRSSAGAATRGVARVALKWLDCQATIQPILSLEVTSRLGEKETQCVNTCTSQSYTTMDSSLLPVGFDA